jgi:uncharacterized membrane protein YdjX (TVP38/TMEM64 family)
MAGTVWRIFIFTALLLALVFICFQMPHFYHYVEKMLTKFLVWIQMDVGPWGPLVLALAYIPCAVLALPATILTLGGGYLFGLVFGFTIDSIGSTLGATAAFWVGRTIGRSYVISKLKDYPQFQTIDLAVHKSGFKVPIVLHDPFFDSLVGQQICRLCINYIFLLLCKFFVCSLTSAFLFI